MLVLWVCHGWSKKSLNPLVQHARVPVFLPWLTVLVNYCSWTLDFNDFVWWSSSVIKIKRQFWSWTVKLEKVKKIREKSEPRYEFILFFVRKSFVEQHFAKIIKFADSSEFVFLFQLESPLPASFFVSSYRNRIWHQTRGGTASKKYCGYKTQLHN